MIKHERGRNIVRLSDCRESLTVGLFALRSFVSH